MDGLKKKDVDIAMGRKVAPKKRNRASLSGAQSSQTQRKRRKRQEESPTDAVKADTKAAQEPLADPAAALACSSDSDTESDGSSSESSSDEDSASGGPEEQGALLCLGDSRGNKCEL